MKKYKRCACFLLILSGVLIGAAADAQKIQASYTPDAFAGPFSGKVILYLSREYSSPKDLYCSPPAFCCFSITVKDIKPNTDVVFDDAAVAYPAKLSDIERGEYFAQVVWDRNTGGRSIGNSPDNMYNMAVKINLTKNFKQKFLLKCDSVIPHAEFEEMPFMKEIKVHSDLLSTFHQRETTLNGAGNLPAAYYDDTLRRFPVEFVILGFGGDYLWNSGDTIKAWPLDTVPCIRVFLDGNCQWGHCTYANSMNNGPCGDALVKEFIPALEEKFRCNGARLVSGHSSGGWSALWLQVNYPETFAGCWASSPDPVDFRCFQWINLYEDKNLFYDTDGFLRNDAVVGRDIPWLILKDDYRIENVLYRGEQWQSWNAAWGWRQKNGMPESICDVNTGAIDSVVVSHWKAYDISLLLRTRWAALQPFVDGKIRVTAGRSDNFALDRAVKLLEKEMTLLNAHFEFAYYGGDHFTVWDAAGYAKDGQHFLAEKYAGWLSLHPSVRR